MKITLIAPLCLLSVIGYSQNSKFTFKLGGEYELPRKTADLAFLGNEKDGIVNLSLKKEELIILKFDPKSLSIANERNITLSEATRNFTSEIVTDFQDGRYYWLHSDWDKSSETESLYCDKIDVSTGKLTETNRKLVESGKLVGTAAETIGLYSYKQTGKYNYTYDADRKKLLVNYRRYPESRNDKINYDKIGLYVFDENMKKTWGGEFTMPYTEAVMDNLGFSVDGSGNAYMLAKVYDNDSRREMDKSTGNPAYRFEVMKFSAGSKKIVIAPIKLEGGFIRSASLTENKQHEMIISCTYGKKAKGTGTEGVFLAVLDPKGKLANYKKGYYPFPKEELEKHETNKVRRKMEKDEDYETPNLKVRDVLVDDDGGIFISCEEYSAVTTTYSDSRGRIQTRTTYYYNDILGVKINAAGEFDWLRKIYKRQRGTRGRGTMSFMLVNDPTGYYFLYLDNIKNLKLEENEVPKLHVDGFGGQVIVSKLSKDGQHTKELLFDTRDEDIMIYPADFQKIDGNRFIGRVSLKRNLYQPVLITTK